LRVHHSESKRSVFDQSLELNKAKSALKSQTDLPIFLRKENLGNPLYNKELQPINKAREKLAKKC